MKCSNCGYDNRTGAGFCAGCGASLTTPPARAPLRPGQMMKGGAYRVVRPLSKGGTGAI